MSFLSYNLTFLIYSSKTDIINGLRSIPSESSQSISFNLLASLILSLLVVIVLGSPLVASSVNILLSNTLEKALGLFLIICLTILFELGKFGKTSLFKLYIAFFLNSLYDCNSGSILPGKNPSIFKSSSISGLIKDAYELTPLKKPVVKNECLIKSIANSRTIGSSEL